jgi:hypothetical protein
MLDTMASQIARCKAMAKSHNNKPRFADIASLYSRQAHELHQHGTWHMPGSSTLAVVAIVRHSLLAEWL